MAELSRFGILDADLVFPLVSSAAHPIFRINQSAIDNTALANSIVVIGTYKRKPGRSTRMSPGRRPIQPNLS